ncbi:MAG: ADOP family duplicated permease, partial [Bryobacteraceae bacterium]
MRRFFLKLFRRHRLEQDLQAELALHRELSNARSGSIPLGNVTYIAEESRDLWRFNFLENLWRDAVYGSRGLRHRPTLLITAVLSLALGIGANTAIFSLAVEFLLSEPSVKDAGSLVYVRLGGNSHAQAKVLESVRESGLFADVAGTNEESYVNWNDGTETRPIFCAFTTKNFFTALGVPIAYGRGILPDDPDNVVVLHHLFWTRHFNGDPSVVGRSMNLDGKAYTIVGILPAAHRSLTGFGFSPDVYLPQYLDDTVLAIYARLKPGMGRGQALAGLRTVATRLDAASLTPFKLTDNIEVSPIAGVARFGSIPAFTAMGVFFALMLLVVGLVLLIACVNVAGLLLARASARKREIAIRLSLGASRGRLFQQLLVESLLLALLGAGCGLALARGITMFIGRLQLPIPIPIHLQIEPDWRLALYAAFLIIGVTLACGLLPALQASKESITPSLQRERRMRLRRALVTAQIAISLIVLSAGFLFLRNLFRSAAISPGFDVIHTLLAEVDLPPAAYHESERILLYANQSLRELSAIPGIETAAAARIVPFTDNTGFGGFITFSDTGERRPVHYEWNAVTPGYFRTMDIPLLQGRGFLETDHGEANVAIVNAAFVRQFLGGRQPVGAKFRYFLKPFQIVGVVADTKTITIGEDDQPQLYEPLAQIVNDRSRIQFVLRSATPPATQLAAVREALRRVEPGAGLEVATLYSSIGIAFLPSQVGAVLMGSVGLLGLVLAAVGLYGTMVYSVARRTREIGVRVAIGATPKDV